LAGGERIYMGDAANVQGLSKLGAIEFRPNNTNVFVAR